MISQLRKKHPITQPNIGLVKSKGQARRLAQLACCGALLLLFASNSFAASSSLKLRWESSRATKVTRVVKTAARPKVSQSPRQVRAPRQVRGAVKQLPAPVVRKAGVVNAYWDAREEGSQVRQTVARDSASQTFLSQHHSEIIERPTQVYDPFEEDDQNAELPDDPFDDPFDEPIDESMDESMEESIDESMEGPESEEEPVEEPLDEAPAEGIFDDTEFDDTEFDDTDAAEEVMEAEIKRRRSEDDLFGEDIEDSMEHDSIDDTGPSHELVEPIDEKDVEDIFGDRDTLDAVEDATNKNTNVEEMLQPEADDQRTPRVDFEEEELSPEEIEERRKELEIERLESLENCRSEFAEIQADRLSSINLSIRVEGVAGEDFPFTCAAGNKIFEPRQWPEVTYHWKASALGHKPLYFEQVQLERYGHSWGPLVQPLMSGAHFFGTLPILPYKMGIRAPNECVYALGYYRPGSCAPYMIDPIPFTWRAAMFQGSVVTGLSYIIP